MCTTDNENAGLSPMIRSSQSYETADRLNLKLHLHGVSSMSHKKQLAFVSAGMMKPKRLTIRADPDVDRESKGASR